MEFVLQSLLIIHVLAGILTLLSGPVAIFYNFKDPKNHRRAGKVFFYAMLVVCFSAVVGFLKQPDKIFYQFLLGISLLVFAGIIRGVRAIMLMKGGRVYSFDMVYSVMLALVGVVMVVRGAWLLQNGTFIAFPVLFGVFGLGGLGDAIKNFRIFGNPLELSKSDWMRLHLNSMLGAFIASTTAFTVNVADGLPWYIQWFGPTILLVPINIYFSRKVRGARGVVEA